MRAFLRAASLVVAVSLGGCSDSDTKEASTPSQQPLKVVHGAQARSVELVARLCAPLEHQAITALASTHRLTLVRRPAPTLAVFAWSDTRTADVVMQGLRKEKDICAVEVDRIYHATQPTEK